MSYSFYPFSDLIISRVQDPCFQDLYKFQKHAHVTLTTHLHQTPQASDLDGAYFFAMVLNLNHVLQPAVRKPGRRLTAYCTNNGQKSQPREACHKVILIRHGDCNLVAFNCCKLLLHIYIPSPNGCHLLEILGQDEEC